MSLKEAREKALEIHNKYRSRHHDTPPMRLVDDLNEQVLFLRRYQFNFYF